MRTEGAQLVLLDERQDAAAAAETGLFTALDASQEKCTECGGTGVKGGKACPMCSGTGMMSGPPTEFRIFKAGENRTRKGVYLFEAKDAERVMQKCAEFGADYSIDYGHSMFSIFGSADPAEQNKAAGWFKAELRAGDLWATDVTWTPLAQEKLKAREYRYISPTFNRSEDGHIEELLNVALTNIPATNGLRPLVASTQSPSVVPTGETMDPKLIALLGLSATATVQEALAAIQALQAKGQSAETLLALTEKKSAAEAAGVVMAWKVGAENAAKLAAKVEELEAKEKGAEVKALLDAAVKEGKVAPAQREHLATLPTETLKAFLSAAPKILPKDGAGVKEPKDGEDATQLSKEDMEVAKLMGTDPKKLAKLRAEARGVVPIGDMSAPLD